MRGTAKLILRYGLIMCAFAIVSGALLALTYQLTNPKREANVRQAENKARQELLPQAVSFVPARVNGYRFWKGLDAHKQVKGYILKAVRRGYSSNIEILIAVRPDHSVSAIKILTQAETPGLGTLIEKPVFTKQFIARTLDQLALRKDGGEIDAVTGATISSRAVADGVRLELETFKKVLPRREGK